MGKCTKASYPTEERAWAALEEINQKRRRGKKEASVYYHRACRAWHLTAKPPKWVRKFKN